jgi:glucose/mannose-6-phosphate isomerase
VAELDNPETLAVDRLGLIPLAGRAAADLETGRAAAEVVELPFPGDVVRDIAICGMGGSAIAGELVAGAYAERMTVQITVVRDYVLPGWVGEDTLVILSSYSGNTEETLTCAMQALERGSLAVCVTSGGKLGDFYAAQGVPVIAVPPGIQPRAALPHLLAPLVVVLGRLGLAPDAGAELDAASATLREGAAAYGPDVPEAENPAKQLAAAVHGTMPLVYGAETTAAVARRWKGQFNENAKIPSFWAALPELDHNEIVGFEGLHEMGIPATLLLLREERQHRQVQRRFELTKELVESSVRAALTVTADGARPLARVLDLVLLGDYVSLYLACLRQVDPGPVDVIERLKDRLATTGYGRAQGE